MKRELLYMSKVAKMTIAEGMAALMDIIGDAEIKTSPTAASKTSSVVASTPKASPAKEVVKKVGPTVVYEGNSIIEVDGKKVTTGPRKRGRTGARGGKDDAGKNILRPIYVAAVEEFAAEGVQKKVFQHSTEGMIVRLEEADYSIKITKSINPKFDAVEVNAEADFSTRGKVKNSAGAIARKIYSAIAAAQEEEEEGKAKEERVEGKAKEEGRGNLTVSATATLKANSKAKAKSDFDFKIVNAKASGIVVQGALGEYTIKISKKRERVGFEAEKAVAFEN